MNDEDYNKTDWEEQKYEDKLSERDRIKYKKIKQQVNVGLNVFEVILWIIIGICMGLILSMFIKNGNLHGNQHTFVEGVGTDIGSYTLFIDTNRTIIPSQSTGKSMYPSMYSDSFQIYLKPLNISELEIGDVIWYKKASSKNGIVHRIVKIGIDDSGWYARTKGDNNLVQDRTRVRFNEIRGVLIGITY